MSEEDSQRRELWSKIIERLGVQDANVPLPSPKKQKQLTTQYHQIYYNVYGGSKVIKDFFQGGTYRLRVDSPIYD